MSNFWQLVTVEMANAVNVVLVKSKVGIVSGVPRRHDGILHVGTSQTKRHAQLTHSYLQ